MIKYIKFEGNQKDLFVNYLIKNYGLPTISSKLNIYSTLGGQKFQIEFDNKDCKFKIGQGLESEFISIRNNKIKYFLKSVQKAGMYQTTIGNAISYNFELENAVIVVYIDTFIGNFSKLEFTNIDIMESLGKEFSEIGLILSDKADLDKLIYQKAFIYEDVINEYGLINSKIRKYCTQNNVELNSNSLTIKSRLEGISNDYSHLENHYRTLLDIELLGDKSVENTSYFKPVSIVVPCYNCDDTITLLLDSVQSQNLHKSHIKNLQVILVDDFSIKPLHEVINRDKYDFKIDIVRHESNKGASQARNTGLALVKNEYVLFLDGDTLLSKNYILDCVVRSSLIPNAVFMAFRKRIELNDPILVNIGNGLDPVSNTDDSRIFNKSRTDQIGWNDFEINNNVKVELLEDSNYFKNLGYGSKMGIYDLPALVSGHNIFLRTRLALETQGFNTEFQGWGFEDTFFGAQVISNGNFIIPVLSSSVFHIGFLPRDNNFEKKIEEAKHNFTIYSLLLNRLWKPI
jgi:glycosyltransferase involved in cell wall biosynthesis